jgi:hypothetical protein
LGQLTDLLNRFEKMTAYGAPELWDGESIEQTQDNTEAMPMPNESNEDFKEALRELARLKLEVGDRPLGDIIGRYSMILAREQRA